MHQAGFHQRHGIDFLAGFKFLRQIIHIHRRVIHLVARGEADAAHKRQLAHGRQVAAFVIRGLRPARSSVLALLAAAGVSALPGTETAADALLRPCANLLRVANRAVSFHFLDFHQMRHLGNHAARHRPIGMLHRLMHAPQTQRANGALLPLVELSRTFDQGHAQARTVAFQACCWTR